MPQFETQATIRTDLDGFTRGYVECALWLMKDENGESCDDFDGEISELAYAHIIGDCADFQETCKDALAQAANLGESAAQAGHDFYLTRNRHGAGFWDRGLGKVGEDLSEIARPYGPMDLYIGDNGKVYVA